MALELLYSFLTYPKKEEAPTGVDIPLDDSKLCLMLRGIFDNANKDCNVPILFTSEGTKQKNIVMDEVLTLLSAPSLEVAQPLATRLQCVTNGTSGMGLMFICIGKGHSGKKQIVMSRFPADEGIVAERGEDKLSVQFVDQVFLKSSHAYKAVTYTWSGIAGDLWNGHAVDKQINHGTKSIADYWIVDFLQSDFATSPALGTKRLANALKNAMKAASDQQTKAEIASATQLARNLSSKALSIAGFCDEFHFSEKTKKTVLDNVDPARLIQEKFKFDSSEFSKVIAFKQVELDSGAVVSAPADKFSQCFTVGDEGDQKTYTAKGRVIDQRLKSTK
ncbi:hypothetical protein [Propionivibrio dicarboxylicus]|uniref:Nucleoid-associated protein n=1 Tax=Propionivibrio dicarboxylicus TaxID=83767 RepID=A0A1G7Z5M5_9RHOO|nr:hypothetical protein [Propionivibrio dicarboxylicus]SDH03927.1 hypothetical protein SAMN05660652_01079 [Propionivibrio dicarboxylicus]